MFSKRKLSPGDLGNRSFDLFISAFNDSHRVQVLSESVKADRKVSLIHAEYGYLPDEIPSTSHLVITPPLGLSPPQFWRTALSLVEVETGPLTGAEIAVDITGMMRQHLVMLPYMLRRAGITRATFYYSDPQAYVSGERTKFTKAPVHEVRLIPGMEGKHPNRPGPHDVLIVGAGYDHELMKAVAEAKPNAAQFVLLGLPSLQPHMYQESLLKVAKARESLTEFERSGSIIFAPASDPFSTAQVLSEHLEMLRQRSDIDHVYLSPVGAKTQVLGFSWYYWCSAAPRSISMLFPFSSSYARETTRGISWIHEFEMELDCIELN